MPRPRTTKRKPANAKNLKKTTAKGAYRKPAKRNFQKRRAPFVETKKQEDITVAIKAKLATATSIDDTIRLTTQALSISNGSRADPQVPGSVAVPKTYTLLPLNSYLTMNQGNGAGDMNGLTVFSKYLKAKVSIEIPSGSTAIRHPSDLFLIHGFVTLPLGANLYTNPNMSDVTRQNVLDHIEEQVKQYFNQRSDKLHFVPKVRSNIKILGYRKVRPNRNNNLAANISQEVVSNQQGGIVNQTVGAAPIVNMTCKWPMMRKTKYNTGTDQTTNEVLQHCYPNYNWLPFMLLYNPTAIEFLNPALYLNAQYEPHFQVRYNSAHYFSDS